MKKRFFLLVVLALVIAGGAFGQVRFWLWNRAQITPYEKHWNPNEPGNQKEGHMNAYLWWSRFGILGNAGGTVGFDAETATMMTNTGEFVSHVGGTWADWADFWSYSMWYKPLNFLMIRVGKWNYVTEGSAWIMDFFDRTRYSVNGLLEDEFFAGYDNMVQLSPGVVASGSGLSPGALFEGYFGPLTVDLNLKSLDPTMSHLDYLQTIQVGVKYDLPGIGFFRLQAIGFDPDGEIKGNYLKIDQATSQIQFAANISAVPGFEFRVGAHYYLSKSNTNWADALNSLYNFNVDKDSISIPLGFEVTMFNPLTFRVVGNLQFGKDLTYGKDVTMYKVMGQVKYMVNSYLTGLLNVGAYNIGKAIRLKDGKDVLSNRDPVMDFGLGVQLNNIRGGSIQTGVVVQYHTEPDMQVGIAIPFLFDFGF